MSSDSYVEIISGLSEGDEVLVTTITAAGNMTNMMPGGFPGMGGGMPSGGMPMGGGMPSGNMGGNRSGMSGGNRSGGMPGGGMR